MGGLLSLPLLAIPSLSTVGSLLITYFHVPFKLMILPAMIGDDICRLLLWSRNLLSYV